MKALRALLVPVILFVGFVSLGASRQVDSPIVSPEEQKIIVEEMRVFAEILISYATLSLDKPADIRACAQEMLRMKPNEKSCRDKYSVWHSKEEARMLETEMEGKFGGVGLEISEQDGKVVVISPIDGTPAYRAGLKSEDVITKVDGVAVVNITDATRRLRGTPGIAVEITVDRNGHEFLFKVVRETIIIHEVSVKTIGSSQDAIGHIKVKIFGEIMPEELRKEITKFRSQGVNKIILDFRNNPGGLLNSAFDALYDFARAGDVLIVMRERDQSTVYDAAYVKKKLRLNRAPGMFRDIRVVILVNKGSASASEIFAGTMKDWGYPVVGPPCDPSGKLPCGTFGKGVGQTVIPLSGGSSLGLTTFEFLVGNSKTKINDTGVVPTHKIVDPRPSSSETLREDKQLEKAIELLSN